MLARTLYVLILGRLPFEGATARELVTSILSAPIRYPQRRFSVSAAGLLRRLLDRDPARRWGDKDVAEIKAHPFFLGVDWGALLAQQARAPFVPKLSGGEDTVYFTDAVDYGAMLEVADYDDVIDWFENDF